MYELTNISQLVLWWISPRECFWLLLETEIRPAVFTVATVAVFVAASVLAPQCIQVPLAVRAGGPLLDVDVAAIVRAEAVARLLEASGAGHLQTHSN